MYSVDQIELILRAVYVEAWPNGEFNNAPIGKVFQQIKNTMEGANLQTNNSRVMPLLELVCLINCIDWSEDGRGAGCVRCKRHPSLVDNYEQRS